MRWIVAIILSLVVGLGIAWGDPSRLEFTPGPDPPTFQIGKEPTFKMTWYEKEGYLEVIGKNIHLRIHKCGKVEKLEWKEINKNEEKQNQLFGFSHSPMSTYPNTITLEQHMPSR